MSQGPSAPTPRHRRSARLAAWRAMMVTHSTLTPILDEELRAETDIDLQTYDVLLHTFEAGEPGVRMTQLAQSIVVSKSGLTTLVDRLESRSLVERVPDPEDRRAVRIRLTEHGESVFRAAASVHMASIDEHFSSRLTDDEAAVVADVFQRIELEHRAARRAEP